MSAWNLFFRKKIDDALDAWCGPGKRGERKEGMLNSKPARKYAQSKRPKNNGEDRGLTQGISSPKRN